MQFREGIILILRDSKGQFGVVNSYVERLHSRQRRLKYRIERRSHIMKCRNKSVCENSYVARLAAYRHLRERQNRFIREKRQFVYLGQKLLDVCPVCDSKLGDYIRAVTLKVQNRFTGRVYGFATYIHHRKYDRVKQVTKEVKFCYCARNLYEESHGDKLPLNAPVLKHLYLQRDGIVEHDKTLYVLPSEYVDPLLKWGYGR